MVGSGLIGNRAISTAKSTLDATHTLALKELRFDTDRTTMRAVLWSHV